MSIHTVRRVQIVPASLDECWGFFSNPANLARITPPELDFKVLNAVPEAIRPGLMIQYRVRPLFGIPLTWLTEITHVGSPHYFVDEQRVGPYALWHHEHFFKKTDDSHTEISDLVHYRLPFGLAGDIVNALIVKRQVAHIFDYRTQAVTRLFPS